MARLGSRRSKAKKVEKRRRLPIVHVNMGAVGKKIIDHGFVARCCSEMQRRPAIVIGAVDIEALGLTKIMVKR